MKKKILITVLACVLVAALSVGGTLAYLTATATPVTNTFVAGNIGDTSLKIAETGGGTYTIQPGTIISKDPEVQVGANTIKAIVFLKVEQSDNWDNDNMTYSIDSAMWTPMGTNTKNNGTGYYYHVLAVSDTQTVLNVLENDKVAIAEEMTTAAVKTANNATLTFTAYISQYDGYDSTVYTGTEAEIAAHIFDAASFA